MLEAERLNEEKKYTEAEVMKLGSLFHEEWASGRRKERETLKQQGKETEAHRYGKRLREENKRPNWNEPVDDESIVDIIDTPFEDLPLNWQEDNLLAARHILTLLSDRVDASVSDKGTRMVEHTFDEATIEDIALKVHKYFLERRGLENVPSDQLPDYAKLTPAMKDLDRAKVLQGIEVYQKGVPGNEQGVESNS